MKVDEKMIEAGLKAYSSSGTHPVVTIRAIFTAMLSAAPTDYGELVSHVRRYAEGVPGVARLWRVPELLDAIELLSARGSR